MKTPMLALFGLALWACDGAMEPQIAPPIDQPEQTRFELADGRMDSAGDPGLCSVPVVVPADAARVVFVSSDAAPGGDGSIDRPVAALAEAEALSGDDATWILAAGAYVSPGPLAGARTLLGRCAADTVIRGLDGPAIEAREIDRLTLQGIGLVGATALDAANVAEVVVEASRLEGGILLDGVSWASITDAVVQHAEGPFALAARHSALVIERSVIDAPMGVALLMSEDDVPDRDCADAMGCVYSNALYVTSSLLRADRAIEADRAAVRVRASRVESEAGDGMVATRSFVVVGEQSVLHGGRLSVGLYSARGDLRALALRGCVVVDRGADRPFPRHGRPDQLDANSDHYPPLDWLDAEAHFGRAVAGWDFAPPVDWFPAPGWTVAVPSSLRPDAAEPAPERYLHQWARLELDEVIVDDARDVGMQISGHAVRLRQSHIAGTTGPADRTTGLLVLQSRAAPLTETGSSTVALSQIEGVTVRRTEGIGLRVSNAFLRATGEDSVVPVFIDADGRTLIRDIDVSDSAGPGAILDNSVVDVTGSTFDGQLGVGVWLSGTLSRLTDNSISGVRPGAVPVRGGMVAETADGLVLQGIPDPAIIQPGADALRIDGNRISDTGRFGLLVINDQDDAVLEGTLRFDPGAIDETGAEPAALLGALDREFDGADYTVSVEGIELTPVDADQIDVPQL